MHAPLLARTHLPIFYLYKCTLFHSDNENISYKSKTSSSCASETMVDQSSLRRGVQVDLLSGYLLCADSEVFYLAQPMVVTSGSAQTNELSLVE
jgi:hypothetical protein